MLDARLPHRRLTALSRRYPGRRLVVVVPDARVGVRVRDALYAAGRETVGVDPAPVAELARRIGRVHPQAQGKSLLPQDVAHERIRASLQALDASTLKSLQEDGDIESVVRRVWDVVHLLRSNDVAPASLYALTAGSAVRPNRRAITVGFEAIQRHLLAESNYDAADVLGWATAQVRSGRAPHVADTVYAVFDSVEVSEREAAFLRALRDEAKGFYRLGSAPTAIDPPPSSAAARFPDVSVPDVPVPDSPISDGADGQAVETESVAPSREEHASEGSCRTVHIISPEGSADEQVSAVRSYVDREELAHEEVEVVGPASICDLVDGPDASLSLHPFEAGGFGTCRHLVVLLPQAGASSDAPMSLLTDDDRDMLCGLTGAVLPRSSDSEQREAWHLTQALWRGAGSAGVEAATEARRGGASLPVMRSAEVQGGPNVQGPDLQAVERTPPESALGDLVGMLARLRGVRDDRERVHTATFIESVLDHHGGTVTEDAVEELQDALRAVDAGPVGSWIEAADRVAASVPVAWHDSEPEWTAVDLALRTDGTWRLVTVRTSYTELSPGHSRSVERAARTWSRITAESVEAGVWRVGNASWEVVLATQPPGGQPSTTDPSTAEEIETV